MMSQATLDKLKKNPHYKMSAQQIEDAKKIEHPMIEFGVPPIHTSQIERHPTLGRKRR